MHPKSAVMNIFTKVIIWPRPWRSHNSIISSWPGWSHGTSRYHRFIFLRFVSGYLTGLSKLQPMVDTLRDHHQFSPNFPQLVCPENSVLMWSPSRVVTLLKQEHHTFFINIPKWVEGVTACQVSGHCSQGCSPSDFTHTVVWGGLPYRHTQFYHNLYTVCL